MPPASSSPVLAVEGVTKSFGAVHALDGVDFDVRSGEVVALVGDNGAGKSTLVKVMAGIHRPDSGQDLFEGRPVTIAKPSDAVGMGIATIYQDLALCDNLDVVENLFLGREEVVPSPGHVLRSLDETDMELRTNEVLSGLAVTISDVRAEVGTMSGGQRQQVAIARSLLGEPRVVILDEPTAALGVRQTAQVLDLIKRLRDQGHGVVVVTPQPRRRVRSGRPDLRAEARAAGRRLRGRGGRAGAGRGRDHRRGSHRAGKRQPQRR